MINQEQVTQMMQRLGSASDAQVLGLVAAAQKFLATGQATDRSGVSRETIQAVLDELARVGYAAETDCRRHDDSRHLR